MKQLLALLTAAANGYQAALMAPTEVLAATKSDKKMTGNKIKFTILKAVGQADSYLDFSDEDLLWAIDKVLV